MELLIVVVVIAILAAITIVAYGGIQDRAYDSTVSHSSSTLKRVLAMYYIDNGQYPSLGTDGTGYPASGLSAALVPKYLPAMPDMTGITEYVRDVNKYGLRHNYKQKADCRDGVNMSTSWWGLPAC